MEKELLLALNHFIGRASKATYASGGGKVGTPERDGFNELEYGDGEWYYRDSYTGFLRSWGQEVVRYRGEPYWTCLYGGGMEDVCLDKSVAEKTFTFLKKALSEGDKETSFQPRGPESFIDGEWEYSCEVNGAIEKFQGHESIKRNGVVVFTHDFMGGLVKR